MADALRAVLAALTRAARPDAEHGQPSQDGTRRHAPADSGRLDPVRFSSQRRISARLRRAVAVMAFVIGFLIAPSGGDHAFRRRRRHDKAFESRLLPLLAALAAGMALLSLRYVQP